MTEMHWALVKGATQIVRSPNYEESASGVVQGPTQIVLSPCYEESALGGSNGAHSDNTMSPYYEENVLEVVEASHVVGISRPGLKSILSPSIPGWHLGEVEPL